MANTKTAAENVAQNATEATTKRVYELRSANKFLTVSALGVQFMKGRYKTGLFIVVLMLFRRWRPYYGESHKEKSQEGQCRADNYAARAENLGIESVLNGASSPAHEHEAHDYESQASGHDIIIDFRERTPNNESDLEVNE